MWWLRGHDQSYDKRMQPISAKRQDTTGWGNWSTGNCTKNLNLTIRTCEQPKIHTGEWDAQISLEFWDTSRSPNLSQKTRPSDNRQKKRTFRIVPADHRVKLKESEKRYKYLNLARELKKIWNMKVMVIPIVISVLGTIPKGSLKGLEDLEIRGQVGIIQTAALLRSPRIVRKVLESWGDFLSTQNPVKNHQRTLV